MRLNKLFSVRRARQLRMAPLSLLVLMSLENAGSVCRSDDTLRAMTPAWTAEGDQVEAFFGWSVAPAGDVNGDGYSDALVSAFAYDGTQLNEGRVCLYLGTQSGLESAPAWQGIGGQADAWFGCSVAAAGDVNGDGYHDVLVGAPLYDAGQADEGRAYLYLGSAAGLELDPAWQAEGDQAGASFGACVAAAGDINGDGYDDALIGAPYYDAGEANEGRVYLYLGSAGGLNEDPAWQLDGDQVEAALGTSAATAGDVNGDGYADVVVGSPRFDVGLVDCGLVLLYLGSASGLHPDLTWYAAGNQTNARLGRSMASAGDVDGDGYGDLIVGAYLFDSGQTDEGRAYLYRGSNTGLRLEPSWWADGSQTQAQLGVCVATAGDVNGDGYSDVVVGAYLFDYDSQDEGMARVYLGSSAGLSLQADWNIMSGQAGAGLGLSVATAGDVNGDGYSDLLLGAPWFDAGETDEGQASLYLGSASCLESDPTWLANGDQIDASFGGCVAAAGDVNGDGYGDVLIGASSYDAFWNDEGRAYLHMGSASGLEIACEWMVEGSDGDERLGRSVSTAGDVDGDGYDDVIVGAPGAYAEPADPVGRVSVYLGSASGLQNSPAWQAHGDQGYAEYGSCVATAGDVNGDGYADVIVGAPDYDAAYTNAGRAYVYHGSAVGLLSTPTWWADGDQDQTVFGQAVASAGDVNGDGFSDVLVGAPWFDDVLVDRGRAYLYLGSSSGLESSPAWTAVGERPRATLGWSVATAGDVNGDGYSDVIIGAPSAYATGRVGRAYVYLGSSSGLETDPSWTAECTQVEALFGLSVATAGDVNGDGYSDVLVGAPWFDVMYEDEGRGYLYRGSSSGLASEPDSVGLGEAYAAVFGNAMAGALDANGDGYSDVLVGAPGYDVGPDAEGRVYLYFGNEGDGLDRVPRQARAADTAPIALLGLSDSWSSLRLKALGRTAAGRGAVRLEWEIKPLGSLLDGTGLETGPAVDTGEPAPALGSAVALNELVSGLSEETAHHWRMRIASDSPFFPRTPWFSVQGNGPQESDLRTASGGSGIAGEGAVAGSLRFLEVTSPSGSRTQLVYRLPRAARAHLAVFDAQGRWVAVLVNEQQSAGRHSISWDGRDGSGKTESSGVYFARLEAGAGTRCARIVLAR